MPSLPTLIYERRDEYVKALRAADASSRRLGNQTGPEADPPVGGPDLSEMTAYLQDLVTQQMASAIAKLASRIH